ncbi:hypothetical protein B6U98_01070 [Thermoplasmatales archaeon ex4572_165]|nr:MAG: hypothetical protein B6U98_01070 [Thermoplasmatales archaeon ex4572_165]RLF59782.1 MAG: hypothetical protein DRN27_01530 [Thermoplasmata archaeon]
MGRYQKKPYKKQSVDPLNAIDIEKEYIDAMKENDNNDIFDQLFTEEYEETPFFDEPEIVTQLRREEFEGKLPILPVSYFLENDNNAEDSPLITKMNTLPKINTKPCLSYEETLEIARKSFKNISTEKSHSISFIEDTT